MSLARLPAKSGGTSAPQRRLYGRSRLKLSCRASMSNVPTTWAEVQRTFFTHPSAAAPTVAIAALLVARSQQPITLLDVPVTVAVVGFWLIQEWVIHKCLLHSSWEWMGKTIHEQHHQKTYFHVSLDPPWLILSVMGVAAAVFWLVFWGGPLALTATAAYYAAGLVYEWLHYVVHTHWVPPATGVGGWLRAVRRHHMLHHMRNEDYWLSFSAPAVDRLFGTLPATGSSVPLTDMARRAHGAQASKAVMQSSANNSSQAGLTPLTAAADSMKENEPVMAGAAAARR